MLDTAIQLAYLAASVLFILGLKGLSHPDTARRGMLLAELGMLMAIVGTLLKHEIVRRSEEHTSELQSRLHLVCRLLLEKKKKKNNKYLRWTLRTHRYS